MFLFVLEALLCTAAASSLRLVASSQHCRHDLMSLSSSAAGRGGRKQFGLTCGSSRPPLCADQIQSSRLHSIPLSHWLSVFAALCRSALGHICYGKPQANILSSSYCRFSTINICHERGLSGLVNEGQRKKGFNSGSSDTVSQVGGAIVFFFVCFFLILRFYFALKSFPHKKRCLASFAPLQATAWHHSRTE